MKNRKKLSLWERYLTKEISIEFKACLYFFAILFFYCVYRLCIKVFDASILHMAEMIFSAYIMGYIQVFLLNNFDESEHLGLKEILSMIGCTAIYAVLSYFLNWFDKKPALSFGFAGYVLFLYLCVFLVYYSKRKIDDKKLNEELKLFQSRNEK